jgi:hypothetical protein
MVGGVNLAGGNVAGGKVGATVVGGTVVVVVVEVVVVVRRVVEVVDGSEVVDVEDDDVVVVAAGCGLAVASELIWVATIASARTPAMTLRTTCPGRLFSQFSRRVSRSSGLSALPPDRPMFAVLTLAGRSVSARSGKS